MTKPVTPISQMWKHHFRPEEIHAYRRFDKASNECIAFVGDKRQREGLSKEVIEAVSDSLRDKEMQTLDELERLLKKRRLDPRKAIDRMNRLNFGPAPEETR